MGCPSDSSDRRRRSLVSTVLVIELGAGQPDAALGIASEMDLARLWWRYGGGRGEDDGRFARLKALRAMAKQLVVQPGRVAFNIDDLPSPTVVAELLRFDSLREDTKGATVPSGMMCYGTGRLASEAPLSNRERGDRPKPHCNSELKYASWIVVGSQPAPICLDARAIDLAPSGR